MIAIAVFTEQASNNTCEFLIDDIHVENISSEDYLTKDDFDYLKEAVTDFDTKNLKADGSGAFRFSGFEFVEIIKVTQN